MPEDPTPEGFRFSCPHCGQHLTGTPEQIGETAPCPSCEETIAVPRPPPAAASPRPLPPNAGAKSWESQAAVPPPLPGAVPRRAFQSTASKPAVRQPAKSSGGNVVLAVTLMCVAIGVTLASEEGREIAMKVYRWRIGQGPFPLGSDASSENGSSRRIWPRHVVAGLSLEAPFPFHPSKEMIMAKMPAQLQELVERMEVFEGDQSGNPQVSVTHITYKPAIEADLEGALVGSVRSGAAAVGVSDPQIKYGPAPSVGLPARRGGTVARSRGQDFHLEVLVAGSGPEMWQVQVIWFGSATFDADRLLNSIQVVGR